MFNLKITSILFLIILIVNTHRVFGNFCYKSSSYCYSEDKEHLQSRQFSTKTPYPKYEDADISQHYVLPNCSAVKIWLLNRHGTRFATDQEIRQMPYELENIRKEIIFWRQLRDFGNFPGYFQPIMNASDLCCKDFELIRNWKWNISYTEENASHLTEQGWNDIRNIAKSYKNILPKLFNAIYSTEHYRFLHSNTQRNVASYKAFLEGLFGEKAYEIIPAPVIPQIETLLKPYEYCDRTKKISNSIEEGTESELWKFKQTPVFHQLRKEVSYRLGLKNLLSINQIIFIWDMCRYDKSWHLNKPSAWCSAFTPNHVDILEYSEDLKYYYKSAHGSKLNKNLPCSIVNDMVQHIKDTYTPRVTVYLAHSTIVHLFLTALEAVMDSIAIRSDNYLTMNDRKFRSSRNAPFAANLAAIRYQCSNQLVKIGFYLNQKPLILDWCEGNICKLSTVLRKLNKYKNCDQLFCDKTNNTSS